MRQFVMECALVADTDEQIIKCLREIVYGYMRDSKYGRSAVNWEHGWRRHVNFDEFYGGAVID